MNHAGRTVCSFALTCALGCTATGAMDDPGGTETATDTTTVGSTSMVATTRTADSTTAATDATTVDPTEGSSTGGPVGRSACERAATHWVTEAAAGGGSGAEDDPWTLLEATTQAAAGDTVSVRPGTYIDPEPETQRVFQLANSGTADAPIRFCSSEPRLAVIQRLVGPNALGETSPAWAILDRDFFELDGFRIIGNLQVRDCGDAVVRNMEVTEGSAPPGDSSIFTGIRVEGNQRALVQNNYVHDLFDNGVATHNSAAIMVIGSNVDCTIEFNTADGEGSSVGAAFGTKGAPVAQPPRDNVWRFNLAMNTPRGVHLIGNSPDQNAHTDAQIYQNVFINTGSCVDVENLTSGHEIYNNTGYGVGAFFNAGLLCPTDITLYNNLSVSTTSGVVTWAGYDECGFTSPQPFSWFLTYEDYNSISGSYANFALREKSPTIAWDLTAWRSNTAFGDNDTAGEDPMFVNPGGTRAEDYRRASYPSDGRSGRFSAVRGAYITGEEVIGYSP